MKEKLKWFLWEYVLPFLAGFCGVVVALALIAALGVVFMDYDPRTMLEGIEQDLRMLFGGYIY